MPYVDPTGVNPGYSLEAQPDLGLTEYVEDAPPDPDVLE
jgi:hypothetical protein